MPHGGLVVRWKRSAADARRLRMLRRRGACIQVFSEASSNAPCAPASEHGPDANADLWFLKLQSWKYDTSRRRVLTDKIGAREGISAWGVIVVSDNIDGVDCVAQTVFRATGEPTFKVIGDIPCSCGTKLHFIKPKGAKGVIIILKCACKNDYYCTPREAGLTYLQWQVVKQRSDKLLSMN